MGPGAAQAPGPLSVFRHKSFEKNFLSRAIKPSGPAFLWQNGKRAGQIRLKNFWKARNSPMKKSHIAAALALTSCMVVGAAAVNGLPQSVTATFRPDVTLQVNGTAYTIRDTNGNEVAPLLYNGTTYVPLATLGQALGVQVSWDAATQTVVITDQGGQAASSSYIGEAKAKEIALQHAGLSSGQVTFFRTQMDWENGRRVYDVEFYSGNKEYDYEIDATSGAVLSYDFDAEHYTAPSGNQSGNYISQEKAAQLAQDRAPNATLIKIQFEFDDGRAVYEGELREGRTEYEFEIDATTGNFIQWEQDWD